MNFSTIIDIIRIHGLRNKNAHRIDDFIALLKRPLTDGERLAIVNAIHAPLHREISSKGRLQDTIDECKTADGKLYLEETGRDCDGVRYQGKVHTCEATAKAYWDLHDTIGSWRDGIFGLHIITEQEAKEMRYSSRDLVAEAFENGHPHVIFD